MKSTTINVNKKITGIESFEIFNSSANSNKNFGDLNSADELTAEEFLKNELNKEKVLKDRIKVLEEELQRTREESFQAGYQEGKEQTYQDAQNQINEFKSLVKSFENKYVKSLEKMEKPLIRLAKKMADKIIGIDLENSAELDSILLEKLRKLLYELIDQTRIVIEVNPVHLEWLESPGIEKELNTPRSMEINFIPDKNLKPGECKISTEEYYIDETYESKLNRLEQQILSEK